MNNTMDKKITAAMSSDQMITYDDRVNASLLEMRADSKRFPRVGAVPREIAIGNMKKIV